MEDGGCGRWRSGRRHCYRHDAVEAASCSDDGGRERIDVLRARQRVGRRPELTNTGSFGFDGGNGGGVHVFPYAFSDTTDHSLLEARLPWICGHAKRVRCDVVPLAGRRMATQACLIVPGGQRSRRQHHNHECTSRADI